MRKLILLISFLFLWTLQTPAQTLDCAAISLERSAALPSDMIAIQGVSPQQNDIAITVQANAVPLNILLFTDRQPFRFVPDVPPESVPLTFEATQPLYAEPSTTAQVTGTIPATMPVTAIARTTAGDWLQVEARTMVGIQTGWVAAYALAIDIPDLPTPETRSETGVFLAVPFHPDDFFNGGEITVHVEDCAPLPLTIQPLPAADGSFDRVITLMGGLLRLQREAMSVTREQLLSTEPVDLPPDLVTLAISQRLYDGDHEQSMLALQQQFNADPDSAQLRQFLDAIIAKTGFVDHLEAELETYTAWQSRRERSFMRRHNDKPIAQDFRRLAYPTITTAEALAREMEIATDALNRLTGGASGRVLNDLGVAAAVGGAITTDGTPINIIFNYAGRMVYIEKSRLELTAYGGPTVFQDFRVNITPEIFLNENGVSDGEWTLRIVAATSPWRITRFAAYDAARFFKGPGSGTVDVLSAVCSGNGSPCGELPEATTIEPFTWTLNDVDEFWLFEAYRPQIPGNDLYSYVLPNEDGRAQPSNRLVPINAGSYPLIVVAPRENFGDYRGEGSGSRDVIVSEIEISYEPLFSPADLILQPGETRRLCHLVDVEHALPEDGRKDVSYEVKNATGATIAQGEIVRGQEFCFEAGPIEQGEWLTCDQLEDGYETYFIGLISLAENGPRAGQEWHPDALALERSESFTVRAETEAPEKPDTCQGMWYIIPDNIVMTCPASSMTIPVNPVAIPINADSLNSGTATFGRLDAVLTLPGSEVIPPDAAMDILEADAILDDLQTTNQELDPLGRLFTRVPAIARAGASYVVVLPVDSSGQTDGEVLFTMRFSSDTAFNAELLMKLSVPGAGICELTTELEGYFEPADAP